MSQQKESDKLGIGDIISVISLVFLGIVVFFGMNFMTLGNKIPSIIVAVLLTVFMIVVVFLAAYAKGQNRNQDKWAMVKYAMLSLFLIALIPCYIYSAKFSEIQFGQDEIVKKVDANVTAINKMFNSFSENCEQRANAYEIELKALYNHEEGKEKLVEKLGLNSIDDVNETAISQAKESFILKLKNNDYQNLEMEKDVLVQNCADNFNNWNIMTVSQYASDLGNIQEKYAKELEKIYENGKSDSEKDIPDFNATQYASSDNIAEIFKSMPGLSFGGLFITLILGLFGLVKFLAAPSPSVQEIKDGDSSIITQSGGFIVKRS